MQTELGTRPSSQLYVGRTGIGSMSVQNGSKVNLASLSIGEEITGEGDLTVTGTGSSVIVRNDLYIGNQGKAST